MSDPYAQPPRPGEEPPSQPFQPMSYDLAPEFSPSQAPSPPPAQPPQVPYNPSPPAQAPYSPSPQSAQAPYSPPPQSAPPAYGSPPQPAPPVYSPAPAHGAPPGGFAPAPPPPRKRRGLAVGLTVIAAVFVLCGTLSCVFGYPLISESSAKVSAPSQLPGGLTKDTSSSMQASLDTIERKFKADIGGTDSVSGFYNDNDGHQVLMVATTGLILFPDSEVSKAFQATRDGDFAIDELTDQSPGKLGGTVKCGTGKSNDLSLTGCMWADHGSAGVVIFLERDIPESVDLFIQIREAVETR